MQEQRLRSNRWRSFVFMGGLVAILLSMAVFASTTGATPGDGLTGTPLASGQMLQPISASLVRAMAEHETGEDQVASEEHLDADAESAVDVGQISVVKFELEPGGYFGWHQHSGPVWVVITSGELTLYEEDCSTTLHSAGSAFLDIGTHVHNARNEGDEPVEIYATFMLPEAGEARIDMPQPTGCVL